MNKGTMIASNVLVGGIFLFIGFFGGLFTGLSRDADSTKRLQAHVKNFQKTYRILEGDIQFNGKYQKYRFVSIDGGNTWIAFEWRNRDRNHSSDLSYSDGYRNWPKADKDLYSLHYGTKSDVKISNSELLSLVLARERVIEKVLPQFNGNRKDALAYVDANKHYNKLYEPKIAVTPAMDTSNRPLNLQSETESDSPSTKDRIKPGQPETIKDILREIEDTNHKMSDIKIQMYKSYLLESLQKEPDVLIRALQKEPDDKETD